MTFEEAKQQAIDRSDWVLCHGDGYYTARTPDGRDIIGKGENGVFVGGGYRRVVVRVHKGTESIEVYFGMERNGLISALEVGGDHFEAGLEYYRRETRPATEAEEKEAVKYLRARNYTHFKLSKRSACCQDVEYTQSQEYFAEFAENNEFEFYENDICIRHR